MRPDGRILDGASRRENFADFFIGFHQYLEIGAKQA